jgi:hypothetical protein
MSYLIYISSYLILTIKGLWYVGRAFGTAEAASDRMCISTEGKSMVPLSAEHMCFCSSDDGCNGGSPMEAWQWVAKHGLVTGGQQKFSGTGEDPVKKTSS